MYPTLCGKTCVNTMDDPSNCGGCGPTFACATGETCVAGVCMTGADGGGNEASTADASDAATTNDALIGDVTEGASDGAATAD